MQPITARPILLEEIGPLDKLLMGKTKEEDRLGLPLDSNFFVIPVAKPHLRSFVTSFGWNSAGNSIDMSVKETPSFSAYSWIEDIKAGNGKSIVIVLMDGQDREVARVEFNELTLTSHNCGLYNDTSQFGIDRSGQPLQHHISLTYRDSKCQSLNGESTAPFQEPDDDWYDEKSDEKIRFDEQEFPT